MTQRRRWLPELDALSQAQAVDLATWRAVAPLGDAEAAELAAGLIELAADTDSSH
jgi:hypothetical protein